MSRICAGAPASKSSRTIQRPSKSSCKSHLGHFILRRRPLALVMFCQESIRIHCGLAAIGSGGDRLSISMFPYIARREDSRNISLSFVLRHIVFLLIEIDDSFEDLGVRLIAYSDEDPISCQSSLFSTLHILKSYSADLLISQNLSHLRIPSKLDSGIIHHSVLHDLACPQLVPPMDDRDLPGDIRQKRRIFHRGISAAYDRDFLVFEEAAVAGRAARHSFSLELRFRRNLEPFRVRTCGNYHSPALIAVHARSDRERLRTEIHFRHVVVYYLWPKSLGLLAQVFHQLRSKNALREAGKVLHIRSNHQLSAWNGTGKEQGLPSSST